MSYLQNGYWCECVVGHPRASANGTVYQHVLIAERVRGGRPLPPKAEVHHFNEIKSDNRHENLVVVENHAYHMLLHMRKWALDACGNPNWRQCAYCHKHDAQENLIFKAAETAWHHRECRNAYRRARYRRAISAGEHWSVARRRA